MATVRLTEAWWKKNKAKTLLNTGMSKTLKNWEGSLKAAKVNGMKKALVELGKTIDNALKKANKVTHKGTIKHLKEYKDVVAKAQALINGGIGKLKTQLFKKPVKEILERDKKFKDWYWDSYGFLYEMMKNGKKGSQKIYDDFISPSGKYECNLNDGKLQKALGEDVQAGEFDTKNWKTALAVIAKTWSDTKQQYEMELERIEVETILPVLKKL